jgi:hypothetical protein
MSVKRDELKSARGIAAGGAVVVAGGVAVAGTLSPSMGGAMVVTGWLALVWAIHRLGRARGAREP